MADPLKVRFLPVMDTHVNEPVDLGIIGAGIMGRRLLDAALGAGPEAAVRVAGIWDPAPGALAGLPPGIRALPSAEAVIAGSECIYVASPPATHLAHARAALAAGRAVFCEKPLAVDVADARRFMAQDAVAGRVAVNFPFASALPVARLRDWIAEGAIGVPHSVSATVAFARWPRGWQHAAAGWLDRRAEGGFTREVVSHFLFLAHRLFGPLAVEHAEARFPDAGRSERFLSARLRAGEVAVSLDGSVGQVAADDSNLFVIEGTGGSIRLRDWATAERLLGGAWQADPGAIPHAQGRPLTLLRQLDGLRRLVRGEPHQLATAAEAFAVQEAVEIVLHGA